MNYRFNIQYYADNTHKYTSELDNEDFSVDLKEDGGIITLTLNPKRPVSFSTFQMYFDNKFSPTEKLFTNGYQSWTVTKEYSPDGMMDEFNPRILGMQKKNFNVIGIFGSGDLLFHRYPEEHGVFYGYSYAYIRNGGNIRLYGSLSERVGYTIITFDSNQSIISIEKDLEGVTFTEEKELLSLAVIEDGYDAAFDRYFELMNIAKPTAKRACGYTTWYNYYTKVTEDIVYRDLEAISKLEHRLDIFQIDDGYERAVGDWLVYDKKKFPNGMKKPVELIHQHGMKAGIWLAPFAVTPKSYIYKEHKDWIVCDDRGRRRITSHNWGGFYTLDIYNEEVRSYLRQVFDTVFNEWGYDMVKLDFLYACCLISIHGKSRGEIMCDAIDFLRECCGDHIILGCGTPLHPAFGKFEYCRVGADVGLCWENKAYAREDVSTQHTLTNTMYRRHLDGRAWLNDPDVFLLRDANIKMPLEKREIIARINSLFGNLLFVSDDVSTYTEKQMKIFIDTISRPKAKILSVEADEKKNVLIKYELDGESAEYGFNIVSGETV